MNSEVVKFKELLKGKILFLGMGNSLKSDDAAGLVLLERLRDSAYLKGLNAEFWSCSVSPENYLGKILKEDFDIVIIIDALHMEKEAGGIVLVSPDQISSFSVSTHSLSPRMFVEYLRGSKKLNIHFLGIQPKSTAFNEGLSPQVSGSIDKFVEDLRLSNEKK